MGYNIVIVTETLLILYN